jgi:hypothetical protein
MQYGPHPHNTTKNNRNQCGGPCPTTTTKAPSPSKWDVRVSIRERWAERGTRVDTTRPQPCEPLLAGWITGANGHVTTPQCDDGDGRGGWKAQTNATQYDNPAPTPSPVSHCLQGGLWVLMAMSPPMTGKRTSNVKCQTMNIKYQTSNIGHQMTNMERGTINME